MCNPKSSGRNHTRDATAEAARYAGGAQQTFEGTVDEQISQALAITPSSTASERTVDITTIGAKSGRARRIEIWYYRVDGEIYLSSQPAVRSWYANLLANPEFTFHLKHGVRADLSATATPVLEATDRERIFTSIVSDLNHPRHSAYLAQPVEPVEDWVAGSPLMHVTFG
jgi:deazaflavin-dependent oxidoreductase (nitroreductase family)